jgi:hypothetical protein
MSGCLPLLTLYEKFMKYISKDVLIMVGMWGDNYHSASRKAFFLVKVRYANEGQSIFSWISFIMFSIKFSVSLIISCGVYCYCYFLDFSPFMYDISQMDTPIVPFLFMLVTSMFITSVWIGPFDVLLRGVFMCYGMDSEMFTGINRYTEDFIQEFVDKLKLMSIEIKKDRSAFGVPFCCKKRRNKVSGNREDNGVYEDMGDDDENYLTNEAEEDLFGEDEYIDSDVDSQELAE